MAVLQPGMGPPLSALVPLAGRPSTAPVLTPVPTASPFLPVQTGMTVMAGGEKLISYAPTAFSVAAGVVYTVQAVQSSKTHEAAEYGFYAASSVASGLSNTGHLCAAAQNAHHVHHAPWMTAMSAAQTPFAAAGGVFTVVAAGISFSCKHREVADLYQKIVDQAGGENAKTILRAVQTGNQASIIECLSSLKMGPEVFDTAMTILATEKERESAAWYGASGALVTGAAATGGNVPLAVGAAGCSVAGGGTYVRSMYLNKLKEGYMDLCQHLNNGGSVEVQEQGSPHNRAAYQKGPKKGQIIKTTPEGWRVEINEIQFLKELIDDHVLILSGVFGKLEEAEQDVDHLKKEFSGMKQELVKSLRAGPESCGMM